MNILVKMPTRGRPTYAVRSLESLVNNAASKNLQILLSVDSDDPSLPFLYPEISHRENLRDICQVVEGSSPSKVDAMNRDIPPDSWDVVVAWSDDFTCIQSGWDDIIRADMTTHFPSLDGALNYPDGLMASEGCCTLPILGRRLYQAFGYIYHPAYQSLWCDTEQTEVCQALGKIAWLPDRTNIFRHDHWCAVQYRRDFHNPVPKDPLYLRNDALNDRDKAIYTDRKALGFDIDRIRHNLHLLTTTP